MCLAGEVWTLVMFSFPLPEQCSDLPMKKLDRSSSFSAVLLDSRAVLWVTLRRDQGPGIQLKRDLGRNRI